MRCRRAVLMLSVSIACTDALSVPDTIRLTNGTDEVIAYVAVEQGTAALVDPNPRLEGQTVSDRAVRAGETVVVDDIMGYLRGHGVVFFLYRVNGRLDDPGVTAEYATSLTVTGDALRQSGGRVEVFDLGP